MKLKYVYVYKFIVIYKKKMYKTRKLKWININQHETNLKIQEVIITRTLAQII